MPNENPTADTVTAPDSAPPSVPDSAPDSTPASGSTSVLESFSDLGLSPTRGLDDPGKSSSNGAPRSEPVIPRSAPDSAPKPGRAELLKSIKDPAMAARLKNMSNDAFDYFYQRVLREQNGEFMEKSAAEKLATEREAAKEKALRDEFDSQKKEALSTRYSDHEHGYKLMPEYQELESHVANNKGESEFWTDQLSAFDAGEPVHILQADAQGNVTVSAQAYDPKTSPQLKGYLIGKITQAQTIAMQLKSKLDEFPKQHKGVFEKFNGSINALDTTLFGAVKNPAFIARVDQMLAEFPKSMQSRPEIKLIAKMRVAGEVLEAELTRVQQELAAAKKTNGDGAAKAGAPSPKGEAPAPGSGSANSKAEALATLHRMAGRV